MAEIRALKGEIILVDDCEYDFLLGFDWRVIKAPHTSYAVADVEIDGKSEFISMHRLLAEPTDDQYTDHRNGNGLDNRMENLRPCTPSQNQANRRPQESRRTPKGVWAKNDHCFVATITANQKCFYLGTFKDELSAAKAYNEAARKYHGAFARLNPLGLVESQDHWKASMVESERHFNQIIEEQV